MTNIQESNRSIDHFLTPDEQKDIMGNFSAIARKTIYVGDPDYRRKTREDLDQIETLSHLMENSSTWSNEATEVYRRYQDIIGSSDHTILAKVYACFGLVDIVQTRGGAPEDFNEFLRLVDRTEPQERVNTILVGALYSRFMAWAVTTGRDLKKFDEDTLGHITNREEAILKLQIQSVASTLIEDFEHHRLHMRMPDAFLKSDFSYKRETPYEILDEGIPMSVMYLQRLHLVSYKKLFQAVRSGIPDDIGPKVARHRLPRILVGVEADRAKRSRHAQEVHKERIMRHVSTRALRKQQNGKINWKEALLRGMHKEFSSDIVFDHCSFDTLSFIAAIRTLERMSEDRKSGLPIPSQRVINQLSDALKKFQRVGETDFGGQESILSLALSESQRIDGSSDWDQDRALWHIESQAIGLMVKTITSDQSVVLRTKEELWEMYMIHVLEAEITREDKLEMMSVLFENPQSRIWEALDQRFGSDRGPEVVSWLMGDQQLPQDIQDWMLEKIYFHTSMRSETVRNRHVPVRDLDFDEEEEE